MSVLDPVGSIKVKLGALVAASALVAAVVATLGRAAGVSPWLGLPVTIGLALGLTQLLASGMTSPLRQMTEATRRMAAGDYSARVTATSSDEIGQLATAFNTMAADLATVDRERRDLVATVSHEIRTPLAALSVTLENLADGVQPATPDALEPALAQTGRLSALVSDLLELSRLDAGAGRLGLADVGVADLLARAIPDASLPGRAVTFDVEVDPPDLTVSADPARLRQLVVNLLDNAGRHSPSGSTVRVRAGSDPVSWWLEIIDEGPGVAVADRERAFERFGTLAAEDGGGTGLGLAIARWVARLHGGAVGFVDPLPGATGARVRAELPRRPDPDTAPSPEEHPMSTVPATPAPLHPVSPPSLLDGLFGRWWPAGAVPARPWLLLAGIGIGALAGTVLPLRWPGLNVTVVLLAVGALLVAASRRRRDPFTLACGVLAALATLPVLLLDALWIDALCLVGGVAVCLVGLTGARGLPGIVVSGLAWPLATLRGLPWLGRTLRVFTGTGRTTAVVRTVAWSALGVVVFGVLFASADALFARWVGVLVPDWSFGTLVLRAFVGCAAGGAALAAAYVALDPPAVDLPTRGPQPLQNRFEWLVPVLFVDAVFAVFLAAQATVIFGGHAYLERTTGITYADYVHQGFGQLTVATALTLLVVWAAARRAAPADTGWLRASLGLLCAMTLVVVASALYRMHVYQQAYGFTRLRLFVDVFEGWLGVVVLAVMVAGLVRWQRWLPRFALVTGVLGLLGLAALNPDAWIAERNLDRYQATGKLDIPYLQQLSADAAPVIADRLPALPAACALQHLPHNQLAPEVREDWLSWNLGRHRAAPVLDRLDLTVARPGLTGDPCASVSDAAMG